MKLYVAGASRELERAKRIIAWARWRGHEITHDWTRDIDAARAAGHLSDADLSFDERQAHAVTDLNAIGCAELFWYLVPTGLSEGAMGELCAALIFDRWRHERVLRERSNEQKCHIIASGPGHERRIFCSLVDHQFATDERAQAWIAGGCR